jgi:hypothetical protein
MKSVIDRPDAIARVSWRPLEEGGRPEPPGPVYAATAVFLLQESGVGPVSDHYSLMLGLNHPEVPVEFLAKDLVRDYLKPGARFVVMEGDRAVADGIIVRTR